MKKMAVLLSFLCAMFVANAQSSADLRVDTSASSIAWDAKKVVGGHYGTIRLKEGTVKLNDKRLVGGSFVIDMPSMECTDAPRVTGHLKNADFFDVEKFPTSTFVISNVEPNAGSVRITGKLTIKGITKEISFPATVTFSDQGLTAKATIPVNRTDYDIKYRSGSFFSDLGNRAIEDVFTLEVSIVAAK